jgi:hypothetical protein
MQTRQRNTKIYFGNTANTYYLYTDNQAAEHIATQPNTSDHSRSIDIRHHEIKQDYVEGGMRIGGVSSLNNTAVILTKTLHPPPFTPNIVHTYTNSPTHPNPRSLTTQSLSLHLPNHHPQNNKNANKSRHANEHAITKCSPMPDPRAPTTRRPNLSTLLDKRHTDRHLFLCPRTTLPPKPSTHTSGTHQLQPTMRYTPLPNQTRPHH